MGTLVIYGDASDGKVNSSFTDWATASTTGVTADAVALTGAAGAWHSATAWQCLQVFIAFDTTGLDWVDSGAIELLSTVSKSLTYALEVAAHSWSSIATGAFLTPAQLSALSVLGTLSAVEADVFATLASSAAVAGALADGISKFIIFSQAQRLDAPIAADVLDFVDFYLSDQSGTTDDPRLTLTFTSQYMRPDADVDATGWSTAPLYSKVNEASPDGTVITATAV